MAPRNPSLGSKAWLCARKACAFVTPNSFCQIHRTVCQEVGQEDPARLKAQDESGQDTIAAAMDTGVLSGHLCPPHQLHIRGTRRGWLSKTTISLIPQWFWLNRSQVRPRPLGVILSAARIENECPQLFFNKKCSCRLSPLKLKTTLGVMMDFSHWPHFADEETKSPRVKMVLFCCPVTQSTARTWSLVYKGKPNVTTPKLVHSKTVS